jgi:short-subunit dehydrogenase
MLSKKRSEKKIKALAEPISVCLISGASSGIGEEIAKRFARAGQNLLLVARSEAKLQKLADELSQQHGVQCFVEAADLSKLGAAQALSSKIAARGLQIEVLINNAGVLEQGAFVNISSERHQDIIDLNISGLTAMLSEFLPQMQARGNGKIINVASIAAFQPVVGLASYAASKAYVLSLTEALSEECKGTGVTVTALCPGITATNMMAGAVDSNASLVKIPEFMVGAAADVAEDAYQACMHGKVIEVPGLVNFAGTVMARATPKWLVRRIAGALGRKII